MNSRYIKLSLAALAIFLVTLACEFSFSSAEVENLRLARDEAGQQTTTQFEPADTVTSLHCALGGEGSGTGVATNPCEWWLASV